MNSDLTINTRVDAHSIKCVEDKTRAFSTEHTPLSNPHLIMLLIRAIIIRVEVSPDKKVTLGRFDKPSDFEIDLTPYGAKTQGVSRQHAFIFYQNNHLYIKDLNSTNGTYVEDRQLNPNVATALTNGSEVMLGRMLLQLVF